MQDACTHDGTAIYVRLRGVLFERLENWRRSQSKIPSRSDALRFLIERALAANSSASAASGSRSAHQ
jgi:hypothetical protein